MSELTLAILDTLVPTLLVLAGVIFLLAGLAEFVATRIRLRRLQQVIAAVLGVVLLVLGVDLWLQLPQDTARQALASQPASTPAAAQPVPTTAASTAAPREASPSPGAKAASTAPAPTATSTPSAPNPVAFVPDNGGPKNIVVAQEPFERGWMLWRSDTKIIYVMRESDHTFTSYLDTWDESQTDRTLDNPPAGKYAPQRGFGKLWRNGRDVQSSLGWAQQPETGHEATVSGDGKVTLIKSDRTFRLAQDGTYSISPET